MSAEAESLAAEYTREELVAMAEDEGIKGARHVKGKAELAEMIAERWGYAYEQGS